jgi:hypothetical protein
MELFICPSRRYYIKLGISTVFAEQSDQKVVADSFWFLSIIFKPFAPLRSLFSNGYSTPLKAMIWLSANALKETGNCFGIEISLLYLLYIFFNSVFCSEMS